MSAPPPGPATAPVKIPLKMPVMSKMPMPVGKVPIKMPLVMPGVKLPVPIPKPAAPTAATIPAAQRPPVAQTQKPAPVAQKNVAPPPEKKTVLRASGKDDLDDDEFDTLVKPERLQRPVVAHTAAVKKPVPESPPPRKRARSPSPESEDESSSSSESEQEPEDEDTMSLFKLFKQKGFLPSNYMDLLQEEDTPQGPPPRPPMTKYPSDLDALIDRVKKSLVTQEATLRIKDENKAVSLGTSKINYIDPRIVCAWCKREGVPINKVFSSSILKKFPWAVGVEEDFKF